MNMQGGAAVAAGADRKHHPGLHHTDSHRPIRSKAIYLTAS